MQRYSGSTARACNSHLVVSDTGDEGALTYGRAGGGGGGALLAIGSHRRRAWRSGSPTPLPLTAQVNRQATAGGLHCDRGGAAGLGGQGALGGKHGGLPGGGRGRRHAAVLLHRSGAQGCAHGALRGCHGRHVGCQCSSLVRAMSAMAPGEGRAWCCMDLQCWGRPSAADHGCTGT